MAVKAIPLGFCWCGCGMRPSKQADNFSLTVLRQSLVELAKSFVNCSGWEKRPFLTSESWPIIALRRLRQRTYDRFLRTAIVSFALLGLPYRCLVDQQNEY